MGRATRPNLMKGRAWAYIFLAQINCGLSPQPIKSLQKSCFSRAQVSLFRLKLNPDFFARPIIAHNPHWDVPHWARQPVLPPMHVAYATQEIILTVVSFVGLLQQYYLFLNCEEVDVCLLGDSSNINVSLILIFNMQSQRFF